MVRRNCDYARPGYYVEGVYFRDRYHQACARAKYLSGIMPDTAGPVKVMYLAAEDIRPSLGAFGRMNMTYCVATY